MNSGAEKQTPLSEQELWLAWKEHQDLNAKRSLIEKHLPLVDYVVHRLAIGMPGNVSRDDLSSHGVMGLIDAVDKFDLSRGLMFETYATWRIRGAIIDGLRQGDWVPRSVRDKAKKLEEAYQVLEQHHLRTASDQEVSEHLGIELHEYHQMLQEVAVTTLTSLEEPLREEESETRLSMLTDDNVKRPDSTVHDVYLKQCLAEGIERLTEKERTVITLMYFEDLTLTEISEVLSLTPSRISQLHSKAILRLRGALQRMKEQLLNEV
ncbi:FliA/WhiG family RNA polymerase sigma factor [Marinicrinis sediminis]|uniref:FliA/WhiG family RNA polymerase sigma factor n=1 Tax=Marinicrinis sediminis TaxID=1652465 RepID=A0ABW5R7L1_9BACL